MVGLGFYSKYLNMDLDPAFSCPHLKIRSLGQCFRDNTNETHHNGLLLYNQMKQINFFLLKIRTK